MKMDQKGHDLARIQLSRSPPLALTTDKLLSLPLRFKGLPEIIDMAVQFQ
jgi:hypothetical protein